MKTNTPLRSFFVSFWLIFVLALPSAQALRIKITKGQVAPTPIAVPIFSTDDSGDETAANLPALVAEDLEGCALFRHVPTASHIQTPEALRTQGPRFADWRVIGAQLLVTGHLTTDGSGNYVVTFQLFDTHSGEKMLQETFKNSKQRWRKLAHRIADAIYKRVTGESGYFDTHVAYVHESGPRGKGHVTRLALMDLDGHGHHFLTDGTDIVSTPRFSPTDLKIAYLSLKNRTAKVYVYDLVTSRTNLLGRFDGLTFAPRYSPDGKEMVMSLAKGGTTNLFALNIATGATRQLTNTPGAINTSPCYSPDGTKIVFTSDRVKNREAIYMMNRDGSNQQVISTGLRGTYSQPVWSPRGDLIAYTRHLDGQFYIGIIDLTQPVGAPNYERLIATGYLVESVCWAPNGRVLMFTQEDWHGANARGYKVKTGVYTIDLTGRNKRRLSTTGEASNGAWSLLLSAEG